MGNADLDFYFKVDFNIHSVSPAGSWAASSELWLAGMWHV